MIEQQQQPQKPATNVRVPVTTALPDDAAGGPTGLSEWGRVFTLALIGPPGAGKTALIEATARQLKGKVRLAVVTLNPAAERDADRISRYCDRVQPVNTARPDAAALFQVLPKLKLHEADVLLIESLGGVAGAPQFGQDETVTVLSVAGGDDKAAAYADLLRDSSALLLSKAELQRHVMFDRGTFRADVRRINAEAELIEVSAFENTGLDRWIAWIERHRQAKATKHVPAVATAAGTSRTEPEWFFG